MFCLDLVVNRSKETAMEIIFFGVDNGWVSREPEFFMVWLVIEQQSTYIEQYSCIYYIEQYSSIYYI